MENKKHTLRFRAVNRDTFEAIKSGKKKVETRAATIRYRDIKAGDVLVFVCGGKRFERKIKDAKLFKSIELMLKVYKIKDIMPGLSLKSDLEKSYYSFPGYKEKIKKFGLMAFRVN